MRQPDLRAYILTDRKLTYSLARFFSDTHEHTYLHHTRTNVQCCQEKQFRRKRRGDGYKKLAMWTHRKLQGVGIAHVNVLNISNFEFIFIDFYIF